MGSLEDLFLRHEEEFQTDKDSIIDWLSDSGKHGSKSVYEGPAKILSQPFEIGEEIKQADTLTETEQAGGQISQIKLNINTSNLSNQYENKREDVARNIFRNVGASGSGLNSIIEILKRNDYDLSVLKYHAYEVRGKTRIGVWEIGRRGFVTHLSTEPNIIEEREPSFEVLRYI